MTFQPAGPPPDLDPGRGTSVTVGGRRVAIFRAQDGFRAYADTCPHAGAPLSLGVLRDGAIVCAWHGWRFDCDTGACTSVPDASVTRFAARVRDGVLEVDLDGSAGQEGPDRPPA